MQYARINIWSNWCGKRIMGGSKSLLVFAGAGSPTFYNDLIRRGVKPHMTVKSRASYCRYSANCTGFPLGESDNLSTIQPELRSLSAYAASSAFRLINVDKVQVLLLVSAGSFASASNLSFSGKDFVISLIKYRAPML